MKPLTALWVAPSELKMLRETLCLAQGALALNGYGGQSDIDRLQHIIDEVDRRRPLGPDGTHGDRHTPSCGCDRDTLAESKE